MNAYRRLARTLGEHLDTIVYAALAAVIAFAAFTVWIVTTGQSRIPPGVMAGFALGSAVLTTGIEHAIEHQSRRRRHRSARHRRPAGPVSTPLAERANDPTNHPNTPRGEA